MLTSDLHHIFMIAIFRGIEEGFKELTGGRTKQSDKKNCPFKGI